ncbi:hypothetical protein VULLAG_LOCUS15144 [Vulpes lagopus]
MWALAKNWWLRNIDEGGNIGGFQQNRAPVPFVKGHVKLCGRAAGRSVQLACACSQLMVSLGAIVLLREAIKMVCATLGMKFRKWVIKDDARSPLFCIYAVRHAMSTQCPTMH